ncbi:hypothetical protein [Actinospongicola halichondriae]|uniref:hypothetical protein n=1 Tax=Actinospongicola halichondriae TaxID=3236844 RepID=UPI003D597387
MTRSRSLVVALVAVVLALFCAVVPTAAAEVRGGDESATRVLVVTTPSLRWADLAEQDLPNLEGFLADADVAKASLRTIGARTSIGEGYVTLGAGNRGSVSSADAGLALEPYERFEEGTAAQAYKRRTGDSPVGVLLHLGFPAIERLNNRFLYGAEPGSLGQALADAGRSIGVITNADLGASPPPEEPQVEEPSPDLPEGEETPPEEEMDPEEPIEEEPVEPPDVVDSEDDTVATVLSDGDYGRAAALMAMDRTGQVIEGEADGLLDRDATAPYGVRYDNDAVAEAFTTLWDDGVDVAVVELSDLDRTDSYRREADGAAANELWADALAASDELFGALLEAVGPDTTVIVVSPSSPRSAESLGVFGISGEGAGGGLARSAATRRAGYVALTDVAPTILDLVGVDAPSSMTGTLISRSKETVVDDDLFSAFADATDEAIFRNEVVGPVSVVFVVAQILAYILAAVAIARRRGWTKPVSFLALVILAIPPVVFLGGALHLRDGKVSTYVAGVFAAAVVLAAIAEALAMVVSRRWPRTGAFVAPLSLIAASWAVQVGDILTGGGLQLDTAFGYSPIVAGRFAGFGNLAFAVIAMSAVTVVCGAWATHRLAAAPADGSARASGSTVVAMSLFLALTIVLIGAPMWGSDVGGVLATVPAFTVLVLVAAGIRVDWRRGLLIVAGTIVAVSAFAIVDLSRPEEDRTHLGRLVSRVTDNEGGGFGETLERKINSNISILTSSVWTLTIPAALGLMVFLARRKTGFLRDLQEDVPAIRALLAGGLLVAFLGFALNDSGVAVPAMMFAVLLPFLTYVLLRWDPARR